jgi:hypothetical protein
MRGFPVFGISRTAVFPPCQVVDCKRLLGQNSNLTTGPIVGTIGAAAGLGETAYSLAGGNQPQYPNESASSARLFIT